jgi:large-conductance mechanosensitive channel
MSRGLTLFNCNIFIKTTALFYMNSLAYSEIFFLVSTIGFVIVAAIIFVLIAHLIKAVRTFNSLAEKLDNEIDNLGDTAQVLVDDIRDSFIYKMIFSPKRRILKTKVKTYDK